MVFPPALPPIKLDPLVLRRGDPYHAQDVILTGREDCTEIERETVWLRAEIRIFYLFFLFHQRVF